MFGKNQYFVMLCTTFNTNKNLKEEHWWMNNYSEIAIYQNIIILRKILNTKYYWTLEYSGWRYLQTDLFKYVNICS